MITTPPYIYKTEPRGKQRDVIDRSWHEQRWAFLCRPGTGKTKLGLDTAGLLFTAGRIDALIVVAPNNVHRQWVEEQVPLHLPDFVPWHGGVYTSGMGIRARRRLDASLRSRDIGLRLLSISYEGLATKAGGALATTIANAHRTLLIVDESHRAANTKSSTHRHVKALARRCAFVRIATGTLITQNPFSAWGQFELMGPGLLGFNSLASFKSTYAELLPQTNGLVQRIARDFKERTGRKIEPQIVATDAQGRPQYRNMRHLRGRLELYSSFLTLADVSGTEPLVVLSTRHVDLLPEQRQLYDELERESMAMIDENSMLSADHAFTLAMRLAQITGGFAPTDDDPAARPLCEGSNPKLSEVLDVVEQLGPGEKVVIWCRFSAELRAVADALTDRYGEASVAEYHGKVSSTIKADGKARFINDPDCRYFVAQVRAGATGTDGLQTVSNYMIFYSNDYSYLLREQAIARQARTGGRQTVNVIDIMANDTVDEDIVQCMRVAEDVHERVLSGGIRRRRTPVAT